MKVEAKRLRRVISIDDLVGGRIVEAKGIDTLIVEKDGKRYVVTADYSILDCYNEDWRNVETYECDVDPFLHVEAEG